MMTDDELPIMFERTGAEWPILHRLSPSEVRAKLAPGLSAETVEKVREAIKSAQAQLDEGADDYNVSECLAAALALLAETGQQPKEKPR